MPVPKGASELDDLVLRVDYASTTINYYGHAPVGSATSDASWRIKRETLDSQGRTTAIEFAGSSANFGQIWDNRAVLIYG